MRIAEGAHVSNDEVPIVEGIDWKRHARAGVAMAGRWLMALALLLGALALGALLGWRLLYVYGVEIGMTLADVGMRTSQMGGATLMLDDRALRKLVRVEVAKRLVTEARKSVVVQRGR